VNEREIAVVIWTGLFLLWAISLPKVRRGLPSLFEAALNPQIVGSVLAFVLYVAGSVFFASRVGLWKPALLSDTVFWFVATGFVLMSGSAGLFTRRGQALQPLISKVLGVALVVEVFVNLYVFPLPVELTLVPLLTLLVCLGIVAGHDPEHKVVSDLVGRIQAALGLGLFTYAVVRIALNWEGFLDIGILKLALPIWLTLACVPFALLMGLYSAYSTAFAMIRWASEESPRRQRARAALLGGLHVRIKDVAAFNGMWCKALTRSETDQQAREIVRRFREPRAGGTDSDLGLSDLRWGAPLALRSPHGCHIRSRRRPRWFKTR
jgi:hypothetical protein